MSYVCNAHTHTPFCDGRTPIPEMIERAVALGFTALGFSGHGYEGIDPQYEMSPDGQAEYLRTLRLLQKEETRLRLWVGLERGSLSHVERAPFDYIIGSTHTMREPMEGKFYAVDGSADSLRELLEKRYHGDGLALVRDYYAQEVEYITSFRPDIIGHFDLVMRNNMKLGMFDAESEAYRRIAGSALERAFHGCTLLELNTGGVARCPELREPYPSRYLLELWREMGGRVIINSDCHNAQYLDCLFEQSLRRLAELGYRTVWALGGFGEEILVEREIGALL